MMVNLVLAMYLNSLPPEVFAHDMEAYEDVFEDVTLKVMEAATL